ncbi:Z1 domain-containing protein [Streptomyces sp. NBC_00439]|uniref:Z1 domain-containing protein n=1 Tax=unclassified Streptomyces TaxID=2593676 RepID=UPI002259113F|nr:Z1 domain-containing protein [Streptomyces sp. NBC_00439]MCX5100937.1 Z1 domain-containing protein [Streptomyces sp. NBC_00439]WSX01694.1 Z1 domain-containing protein [Streptomyces sp. NBC_00987]
MTDHLFNLHGDVLGAMRRGPKHFTKLAFVLSEADEPADTELSHFRDRIVTAGPGHELTALWHRTLTSWDLAEQADWSTAPPRTDARRADTYNRLGFGADLRKALDGAVPVFKEPGPTVISEEFTSWYSRDTAAARSFYWNSYEQLLRRKGWSDAAVSSLDEASHAVVERLSDPTRTEAYGARGLVVGYVQSGKTANFTGVAAKAIDTGYRLVIVLGGTLNLLRGQTQRRLDMELIGQENILRGADPSDPDALVGIDYQDDEDWPAKFVSHGHRPFNIERLTTRDDDYQSLRQGIGALEIEKREKHLPLYVPDNLHRAAARVMVVKKNKSVLTNLVKDLRKIGPILREIPTLFIDDESDQASVNTSDPKKWESGRTQRTAINGLISQLLGLLPRAQYVGYTATPFANVFIDPSDGEDIFPRDFLISLPRPVGYMGVQDFHDLDGTGTAEETHVRGIYDDTGDRLQEAMDAFVLTGALKLYRADHGVPSGPFRHHTMLVHESVKMDDHADLALRINTQWHRAGYTSHEGHARLEKLLTDDFARYADDGLPTPSAYADLRPYVSRARQLINAGGNPVVVVNGDTDRYFSQIDLDFDRTPNVWKILVGGTKLSRGFTVEGLTVTYYRRTTRQADTLMQMGRWFGFRPGYRDLVRLYIGREEPLTKTQTIDLYEAFEAICRDEETFRSQLSRYAELIDGEPQVTPARIPPLVSQHLPLIKPSSRNKMFNAELVEIRSPGQPIEPAAYPTDAAAVARNTERWRPLLDSFSAAPVMFTNHPDSTSSLTRSFSALTAHVPHPELMSVLGGLEWERADLFRPHLAYLSQLDGKLAKVNDWLVISPQLSQSNRIEASILGSAPFSLVRRSRQAGKSAFSRIASLEHRTAAQRIIDDAGSSESTTGTSTGVILLYPVVEGQSELDTRAAAPGGIADPSKVIMAFTLIPPTSAIDSSRRLLRFQAKDSRHANSVVVEATSP